MNSKTNKCKKKIYFRISRNYTKIIKLQSYFEKAKRSIKDSNYLAKWIEELLKITCVIPYM